MFTWDELIKAKPSVRRKMWNELKNAAPEAASYWEDAEGCSSDNACCSHLSNGWCGFAELPCGVNPYLTPKAGMLGMACMGSVPDGQLELDV